MMKENENEIVSRWFADLQWISNDDQRSVAIELCAKNTSLYNRLSPSFDMLYCMDRFLEKVKGSPKPFLPSAF